MAEKQWCPGCSREVEGVCHHFNCAIGPNGLDAQSSSSAGSADATFVEWLEEMRNKLEHMMSKTVAEGMSVRDSFAIAAMQGMLAHATRYKPRPGAPANWHDAISVEAYEIADAMLKARGLS
jgi:hypothetical protein